ncbi:uncharacterized protein LOC135498575 [Lineus longissimus]|uniref:uncharacterized protein LOC135498575 n=1 Tax=Lineus longissimus TaxID=88925 RepID=UPI002B4F1394
MSSCDEFTQNAWRKDLCRNCLRPKSEHNLANNEKKQPNKTVVGTKSSGKENCDKSDTKSSLKHNGVAEDGKKTSDTSSKKGGHNVKGRGVADIKTKENKPLKNSPKSDRGVKPSSKSNNGVENSQKTGPGNSEPKETVKKSALKKENYQKRRTSGVTFYVGLAYVIGEDGGLNGSDSEAEPDSGTCSDDEDGKVPLSKEEKQLAKLTYDNTDFNSDPVNLKETAPPLEDSVKSLVRSKSVGSQEVLEIEDALLWNPKTFSGYVHQTWSAGDDLSRKSPPPPPSSATRVLVPEIDIGEKDTGDLLGVVPTRQNESVFKLSSMQPRMNLSKPYLAKGISPSTIVLPYPVDEDVNKDGASSAVNGVGQTNHSEITAKNSGAKTVRSVKDNVVNSNTSSDNSSIDTTAKVSTNQNVTKPKGGSVKENWFNSSNQATKAKSVATKTAPKIKTNPTPVRNTAKDVKNAKSDSTKDSPKSSKDTRKGVGLSKNSVEGKVSVVRKSSLSGSSTSSNSPRGSPAGARKPVNKGAIKTSAPSIGAKSTTTPGRINRSVSLPVGSDKEKPKLSTPDVNKDCAIPVQIDSKESGAISENLTTNSGLKSETDGNIGQISEVKRRQSEPVVSITYQEQVLENTASLNSDAPSVKSPTSTLKRKPIKRPAPPPPPPPSVGLPQVVGATLPLTSPKQATGASSNSTTVAETASTAHPVITRSASVPTPPSDQDQHLLRTMATRTISVDCADIAPRSANSSDTSSQRSNQDVATPKKNKLSSGSFLKKFLRKAPKEKPKPIDGMPDDRSFSPTWVDSQEIEFMDDSFSDGSFDDELVESVELKSANSTNTESSADWNHIFKNFGKSDLEIAKDNTDNASTESPSVRFANETFSAQEKPKLQLNRHSDGSLEQSPDLNSGGKFNSKRKSSAEVAKLNESPQKKWDQDKIETLRKSRDISGPIGLDGKMRTLPQRPVSVAVKPAVETLSERATERTPRPRSLEKSPMHEGRGTIRRDQKPIKKPPAPPPPIPVAALQKRAEEEKSAEGGKRLPLETMTLDRKSRGSPRPTSTGDQITRPKPPPPPPPTTLPRSRSSPDKNPLPRRPPPPRFKPQIRDQSPSQSHVYEEYGTRSVRGSKAPPPAARHQYEYVFDRPGNAHPRDNSPATQEVKPHEYGMAYEPVSVSPTHSHPKPITEKPKPVAKTRPAVNVVAKPKRSHLYEIIHPEDRDSGRAQQVSPPLNGRYESVDESPRHARRKHDHGRGEENIYDVVEVPPIPVSPPDSPTSLSRFSRSFEDYLVPIRRGSVDAAEASGTDDEILDEDTLGSLPDLPTCSDASHDVDEKKKDEGHSVGLLESVLQKLKEPKKLGRKSSAPDMSKSKKMFSTRSLTRRPRSSRHNSLPAGVDIVMIKSQECESLKSGTGSIGTCGTGSSKSGSTGTGSIRSSGSMEEYVDMSGASGKEDDPSPSSTGSIGDPGSSPMLPRSRPPQPQTPSVRGRTCLPAPPTLMRGQVDVGEANVQEMFSNIANMNLQTLNQVLRDMEVPKRSITTSTELKWESFSLDSDVPLMRSAALAFYKATLKATMEPLVLMVSFDRVPEELCSKFHCNGLKQRCNFEDDIACQFHPDSILQQIVGANMGTALTSHCRVTVLEYTNISTLDKYLDTFSEDTDEYFHEVCFILVQLLQYTIYLLDRGYEFSDLTAESLLITQSGQSKNHVLLNPGQVHSGNGDKLKLMCQEIVTLIFKLHEIDSFEIYDKMSHLPYKKTVMKITQLLSAGQFSNMVQGLDMLGFVLWGPTKELRQLQRSNNIALECQCWLDVACAKKVNSLARGEDRDSIWTYYQVKYLCEMDGRKLAAICDTYNLGAR